MPDENNLRRNQLVMTNIDVSTYVAKHSSNSNHATRVKDANDNFIANATDQDKLIMRQSNEKIRHRWRTYPFWSPTNGKLKYFLGLIAIVPMVYYYIAYSLAASTHSSIYDSMDANDITTFSLRPVFLAVTRLLFAEAATKKKLYLYYYYTVFFWHAQDIETSSSPEAKVKFETGKPNKLARLFVTYGAGIMHTGWIYDVLKKALCTTWYDDTFYLSSHQIYKTLDVCPWDPTELGLHARSFSDDMEMKLNLPDRSLLLTFDISSCDATNGSGNYAMHGTHLEALGVPETYATLMSHLKKPILLVNPNNTEEFVRIKPVDVFEGSGDGSTTHINNVYQSNNVVAITTTLALAHQTGINLRSFNDPRRVKKLTELTDDEILETIHYAVSLNGCAATVAVCKTRPESDFLKTFTVHDLNGQHVVVLALGAILRNFGTLRGDLTALQIGVTSATFRAMTQSERMEHFLSGVVLGLSNEPAHLILTALRERFRIATKPIVERYWTGMDRSALSVPLEQLQARYGGSDYEWQQLADEIKTLVLGSVITSPIITRIFEKDYSLV